MYISKGALIAVLCLRIILGVMTQKSHVRHWKSSYRRRLDKPMFTQIEDFLSDFLSKDDNPDDEPLMGGDRSDSLFDELGLDLGIIRWGRSSAEQVSSLSERSDNYLRSLVREAQQLTGEGPIEWVQNAAMVGMKATNEAHYAAAFASDIQSAMGNFLSMSPSAAKSSAVQEAIVAETEVARRLRKELETVSKAISRLKTVLQMSESGSGSTKITVLTSMRALLQVKIKLKSCLDVANNILTKMRGIA